MDNNDKQQTGTSSYQQGNFYQQNDPYAGSYMNHGYGNYGGSSPYGGNPEHEEAPNIFQQFAFAFIPSKYGRLTKVKAGSMIGFVTLLALVATIISFAGFAFSFTPDDGRRLVESLPDFEIADGRLYIDEDYSFDANGMFVYITDDISGFTYDAATEIAEKGYRNIILIGRDRISVMQNGEYQQGDINNLRSDVKISKEWFADTLMPVMLILIILGYIFFFMGRIFWYFLCAAVYLLFAMLFAAMMQKRQPAGALYRVAVYSKVFMFVVLTIVDVIPYVRIPASFILRIVITIGIMGVAIAKLPEKN